MANQQNQELNTPYPLSTLTQGKGDGKGYGLFGTVSQESHDNAVSAAQGVKNHVGEISNALDDKGLVGVGGYLGKKTINNLSVIPNAASTVLSGAMEGTGKLFFGKNNKPAFGMDDAAGNEQPASVAAKQATAATQPASTNVAASGLQVLPTKQEIKPVAVDSILKTPATNYLIPNQPLPDGVSKSLNSKGNVVYSDEANKAAANTAQNQPVAQGGYLTQPKRLSEERVRQLYRELPASSISAAGQGNLTPEQRYAVQQSQPLQVQSIPDPNAYKNALIFQANQHGELGDRARRESALAQLGMLNNNEQNAQNNQVRQQVADTENAMKKNYYDSEALKNNAQAMSALRPKQSKQDIQKDENGNWYSFDNGEQNIIPKSPRTLEYEELMAQKDNMPPEKFEEAYRKLWRMAAKQ